MRNAMWLAILGLAACGGLATGASDGSDTSAALASAPGTFADVEDYYLERNEDAFWTWRGIFTTLAKDFDDVCGDTFCEGDYSNLQPVRLRCSVNVATGNLRDCAYVFAGSYESVNTSTGTIKVNAKTFSCHVPVSGIPLQSFVDTLTAAGSEPPLRRTLPGKQGSIYDSLVGCI
jgi:hypothetical protein